MIQDIKDRVPVNVLSNDAIRYGIYDENGALLRYEYIKREDEPIETGTPINRALLSNIQGDLYTQDRYNEPVVTSNYFPVSYKTDKVLSEELIQGDCIPKDWTFSNFDQANLTAISTSGNMKLYYVNSSSYVDELINGIKIFDGDESTSQNFRVYSKNSRAIIEFDRYIKITKFKLKIQDTDYGTEFDFVGSDDNVNFTKLKTIVVSEAEGKFLEYVIELPKYFKYYGLKVSSTDSTSLSVYELQVTEYYDNVVFGQMRYINNIDLPLKSYEKGKIINIKGANKLSGDMEVVKKGNIFPTEWETTDNLTFNSNGYEISASSQGSSYYVSRVFDDNESYGWEPSESATEHWIDIKCPKPTKISKIKYKFSYSWTWVKSIKIRGKKKDEGWVILANIEDGNVLQEKYLENLDYYDNYQLYFEMNSPASNIAVYLLGVSEYIEVEENPEINKMIDPCININNLGMKLINGTIESGDKLSLVYNGESFDILHVPQQFLPLNGSENEVLAKVGNYAEWQKRPTKVLGSLGYDASSPNHTYTHNFERYKIYKLTLWGKVRNLVIGSGSKSGSVSCSTDNYEKTCVCEMYFWTIPDSGAYGEDTTTTDVLIVKNSIGADVDQIDGTEIGDISKSKSLYISSSGTSYASPVFYSSLLEEVFTEW